MPTVTNFTGFSITFFDADPTRLRSIMYRTYENSYYENVLLASSPELGSYSLADFVTALYANPYNFSLDQDGDDYVFVWTDDNNDQHTLNFVFYPTRDEITVNRDLDNLRSDVTNIQTNQATDEANISTLQTAQAADHTAITTLQTNQTADHAAITTLQAQYAADHAALVTLQANLSSVTSALHTLFPLLF